MFTVTNSSAGAVSVSGVTIPKLGSAEFDFLTTEILAAETAGLVTIDPAPGDGTDTVEGDAAVLTQTALTDSSGGTPGATLAAVGTISTGLALSTSNTYTDAAVNSAVNTAVNTAVNAKLAIIANAIASLATQLEAARVDIDAVNDEIDAITGESNIAESLTASREVGSRLANLNYQGWSNDYAMTHRVN